MISTRINLALNKNVLVLLFILSIFWIVYLVMQNDCVYQASLGKIISEYETNNYIEQKQGMTTYDNFSNNKFIKYDTKHYFQISEHGYDIEKAEGDYIFAFFPLYPFVLKILNLSPLVASFFNYILLIVSLLILLKLFSKPQSQRSDLLIYLTFPFLVVFLIPYTEALYMFVVTIAIYGFMKNKYWIFFIGMLLAALTRPSFSILLLAFVGAEIFFMIKDNNFLKAIRNIFLRILPLILGTVLVSIIQLYWGSGSLFKFIEVQKYWGNSFAIPTSLHDWSYEGFSINIAVVFLLFIPLLIILLLLFINKLRASTTRYIFKSERHKDYLIILSIIYVIGNAMFVILFRHGGLQGMFRFCLTSPFFVILLFLGFDYIGSISAKCRIWIFSILSTFAVLTLALVPFSSHWHFSDTGLLVMIISMGLWMFQDFYHNRLYKVILYTNLFINIIWTTFLFNTFLIARTLFL